MIRFGLSVAILFAAANPATAQPAAGGLSIKDRAVTLALDHCPVLLSSVTPFSLTPELAKFGFSANPERRKDRLFPGHNWLELHDKGGSIEFGGIAGKSCVIQVGGAESAAVANETLKQFSEIGLDFKKDEQRSGEFSGILIDVYRHSMPEGRSLVAAFMFKPGFDDQLNPEATFQLLIEE